MNWLARANDRMVLDLIPAPEHACVASPPGSTHV